MRALQHKKFDGLMFLNFSGLGNDGKHIQFLALASVQICRQLYELFHYNLD